MALESRSQSLVSRLFLPAACLILMLSTWAACAPAPPSAGPAQAEPTPAPTTRPSSEKARAPTSTPQPPATPEPRERNLPTPVAQLASDIQVRQVLDGVQLPVGLTFAPDGRLFFNEVKRGVVRIMDRDGSLRPEPFVSLRASPRKEQGVLGLTLDPDFADNRYVYIFYTQAKSNGEEPEDNRVVRYTERDGVGTERTRILGDLPVGICCHNGGRIGFGPDGKLYVTVGDQNRTERAQSMNRLNGKVLRVNRDGSVPTDNPIPDSPIFALGFRNPYGLAFHPRTGVPYITENGDIGHDEINALVPGGNYGAPVVDGIANDPRFVDPLWDSEVARLAPTGAAFYTGLSMPEYTHDFFFCAFNTGDLTRLRLGGPAFNEVTEQEVLVKNCYLDVANGPDGALYFASLTGIHRLGR